MVRRVICSDLCSKERSCTDFTSEALTDVRGYLLRSLLSLFFFLNKCDLQTENVCSFTSKLPTHIEGWWCVDVLRVRAEELRSCLEGGSVIQQYEEVQRCSGKGK